MLVTIPPLQMSSSVAAHVSHANRFSHALERRSMTAEFGDVDCPIDIPAPIERRYRRRIYPPGLDDGEEAGSAGLP